jgi:predicted nucleic-acid-binding protein
VIGLDTNVLVRYIVQDDPVQSPAATALIEGLDEENQGFVSLVTLVELHWVLRRAYKLDRDGAATVVRTLLAAVELAVQDTDVVYRALGRLTGKADFSDAIIEELGTLAGCSHTATFDEGAAALPGMELVPEAEGR